MINYKKGLIAMAGCYLIWGFQPLYFALDKDIDTTFLLACRIIWAAVACIVILKVQGRLDKLKEVFTDKKVLVREAPASLMLFADWAIYLFAVRFGRIMECSMGYYIMPLVIVAMGALIFKEPIRHSHYIALVFIVIGVVLSAGGFGGFPYVTVLLAVCFAVYSALKKSLTTDSIVGTTAEILMMTPIAIGYILLFDREGLLTMTFARQLFVMGSGIITGLPMVFFAIGLVNLPFSLIGILQYLSPTFGLICSLILGETFSGGKLLSFSFIWAGVVIYAAYEFKTNRKLKAG